MSSHKSSFYEDTLRCAGIYWSKDRIVRQRLEHYGWRPDRHDLQRMLYLLHKHGKIDLRRSYTKRHNGTPKHSTLSVRIRVNVENLKR